MKFNRERYNSNRFNAIGINEIVEDVATGFASARPLAVSAQQFIVPIDPSIVSSLSVSAVVSQTMTDKMAKATITFDKSELGEIPSTYFGHVEIKIPDFNGTLQTVFSGFFPSAAITYGADGDKEVLTAFDFGWFLTMQYLSDDNMTLLTPENQQGAKTYRLYYHHPSPYFEVGQIIKGRTTSHEARIIEVHLIGGYPVNEGSYLILSMVSGDAIGDHYFQDQEKLMVDGVDYAYADGYTMDITGVVDVVYPGEFVRRLLGGDNSGLGYERLTGIAPWVITDPSWSDSSVPKAVDFVFEEKTTKLQAIEQLCKYLSYIFMVKTVVYGSTSYAAAYFIPETDIDTSLGLPAMVTIYSDPYVVSPVTLEVRGEEKYNKVTVRAQTLEGKWLTSVLPSGGFIDTIPIEYYEVNKEIVSQTECDQRCADLYAYYCNQIKTWSVTLLRRSDLRLLQRITFSGVSGIPNGIYRIVGIEYEFADGGTTNQVVCKVISTSQFQYYLNLNRVFTDYVGEVQSIAQGELEKYGKPEIGQITSIDGKTVMVQTERGIIKATRDPS